MQGTKKQSNEFEELVKNISEGLKYSSVEELNRAIVKHLNQSGDKRDEKFWIIDQVCIEHGVSRMVLMRSAERGAVTRGRALAYCLLHDLLDLSQAHIAKAVFNKSPRIVHNAISYFRSINLDIEEDRKFKERYDKINSKFITYMKKKSND